MMIIMNFYKEVSLGLSQVDCQEVLREDSREVLPGSVPGGFPGSAPGSAPGGAPGQMRPPSSPPPNFTPQMSTFEQQEFQRGGGVSGIRRCFFRNTFIWMTNGNAFWFFPMLVQRNQIIGFQWRGQRGWVYDSINRNNILFFQCY